MRAIVYDRPGTSAVLSETDLPVPEPGPGEVRVRVAVSGVNPTDWKGRRDYNGSAPIVPNQDGAGIVDAVGPGVDPAMAGRRVWLWEAARQRHGGTAQEFTVVPQANADLPSSERPANCELIGVRTVDEALQALLQ